MTSEDQENLEKLTKSHTSILRKISSIQVKTSDVLKDQEKVIIQYFNKEINHIKEEFETERIRRN